MSLQILKVELLARLVTTIYRVWSWTWKIHVVETETTRQLMASGQPLVLSFWHGDEIALMRFASRYRVATLVSTSKDGELMNRVLKSFGFLTSRGSSTRQGARALVGLIRLVKTEKRSPVITVDGPKGPIYVPKPGVFELSKALHSPIIPGGVAASSVFVFKKSWNQAYIPLPFSKVVLSWGDPLPIVTNTNDVRDNYWRDLLTRALHKQKDLAKSLLSKKSR